MTKKRMEKQKLVGIFKYDIFPYMVAHDICKWYPDGDIGIVGGFALKAKSLIVVLPKKQGDMISLSIDEAKETYNKGVNSLESKILKQVYTKYPVLNQQIKEMRYRWHTLKSFGLAGHIGMYGIRSYQKLGQMLLFRRLPVLQQRLPEHPN